MGRNRSSSSSSSSNRWRYINPAYYLRRPKRLALLFIAFVCLSFFVWDRQSLVREHEVEVAHLNEVLLRLQNLLENSKNVQDVSGGKSTFFGKDSDVLKNKGIPADHIEVQRREKVKGAMLHAWTSYEKYAWGQDELQPQSKNGVNSFGGLGATLVDSLDTLYIMGLDEQFQRARERVPCVAKASRDVSKACPSLKKEKRKGKLMDTCRVCIGGVSERIRGLSGRVCAS